MANKRAFYIGYLECGCATATCVANEAGMDGARCGDTIISNSIIAEYVCIMILRGYAVERRDAIPEDFTKPCPHRQQVASASTGDTPTGA